jgi:hydroxyacyl-ACP dehydratase HTD2-like protein with hotdog domain
MTPSGTDKPQEERMIETDIEGKVLETVTFDLSRSKLAELARSFHEESRVWSDPYAARAAGFATIPVPPTATVIADHEREGGALAHAEKLGVDIGRLLHGEASWEFERPLRLDDRLTATSKVTGVTSREGKRGGTMSFITTETTFRDQDGAPVATRRDTLIETGARA